MSVLFQLLYIYSNYSRKINYFLISMDALESKTASLEKILNAVKSTKPDLNNEIIAELFPDLVKMKEENDRLKYRCRILETVSSFLN